MGLTTFLKRNWKFVLLEVVLVPILAVLTYLSILSPAVMAGLVVLINVFPKIEEFQNRWETAKRRDQIRSRTAEFNEVLKSFETQFESEFLNLGSYGTENLIEYVTEVVPSENRTELVLLYLYLNETESFQLENHEQTTLEEEIRNGLQGFSLLHPSQEDLELAWGAYQILCQELDEITLNPPGEEFLESDCFQNKFVHTYLHKEQLVSKLTSEKEELSEYRGTLSRLYESGQLNKYGLHQTLTQFDEDEVFVSTDKTHYFIIMNKIQDETDIKDNIRAAVVADGHQLYPGSLNIGGAMYSLLLCVSDVDKSTETFYDDYVKQAYEKTTRDGWLSVHRSKFEGDPIFQKRYQQSKPNAHVKRGMSSRNILTTGEKAFTVNLREEFIEASLSTDELLSVLPLNLFLPELPSEKKEILVENNEEIKEKFGIRHLTDWANPNHTSEEIGLHLQREYFPDDDSEFWIRNAEQIVAEASSIQKALS